MMNLVMIDDDVLALTKLRMLIQLKNIHIVGEFTQPEDALQYIRTHDVDIVITDMKMPRIDGIELIQQVKQNKPKTEVIAISSYKDFNYVKDSFKEGSVDYILKHSLSEEVVTHALIEAVNRIKKDRIEISYEEDAYYESQEAIKEKIFAQLFHNEITIQKMEETFHKHKITFDVNNTILILCEIDDYAKIAEGFKADDKRIFLEALKDMIRKVVEKVPEKSIVAIKDGCYGILLSYTDVKSQLYMYSMSTEYCRRLNGNVKKMLDAQLSVCMGNFCTSLEDLKKSYEACTEMLKNKFFAGKGQVYQGSSNRHNNIPKEKFMEAVTFRSIDVYNKLMIGDESYIADIEAIFGYYKQMKFPISVVDLNLVEMLNTGCKAVNDKQLTLLQEREDFQTLYKQMKKLETVDEIKDALLLFYRHITEAVHHLNRLKEKEYSKYTVKALQYMELHYQDMISQQEIAEELGVHYVYLSKMFKKDVGCNFSEHLNRIRIDKAKELIESQKYRIKEIYPLVGFNQYNYFFKVFKQLEGCTPLAYSLRYETKNQ